MKVIKPVLLAEFLRSNNFQPCPWSLVNYLDFSYWTSRRHTHSSHTLLSSKVVKLCSEAYICQNHFIIVLNLEIFFIENFRLIFFRSRIFKVQFTRYHNRPTLIIDNVNHCALKCWVINMYDDFQPLWLSPEIVFI